MTLRKPLPPAKKWALTQKQGVKVEDLAREEMGGVEFLVRTMLSWASGL